MASCNITPVIPAASRRARSYFFLNTGTPGVRFLQYDEPTETTFRELFESVGFIKDCRDTAKKNEQGFVVCATDDDAIQRDSTPDANGYTKSVLPHQLPNVYAKPDGCGIEVTDVINTRNCCDGTAKDFEVTNIMVVDDNNDQDINGHPNPIEVTQSAPGCDTSVFFNPVDVHNANGTQVEPGKVVVCDGDTSSQYLSDVFTTNTPCTVEITAPDADTDGACEINIDVNPFLFDEIRMIGPEGLQNCFKGNVGEGQYDGWYLCTGYQSPNGKTVDLSAKFIAGYDVANTEYNQPGLPNGVGQDKVTLGVTEVPVRSHTHVIKSVGTAYTANDAAHNHEVKGIRSGGSGTSCKLDEGLDINPYKRKGSNVRWQTGPFSGSCNKSNAWLPDGAHQHAIDTSQLNLEAETTEIETPTESHENRPEYIAMAFIQYKGPVNCDCRLG